MAEPTRHIPSITLVRRIAAPPEKVFAAFLEPELIMKWWGPDAGPTLFARTDPKVGGRFHVAFERLDGQRFENVGEYLVIEPPSRLVMSWEWSVTPGLSSVVTVMIKADGAFSELTVIHDQFVDAEMRDRHALGWVGALDKLVRTVEAAAGS
jgi:uncharacterized protein YndB with AHSA1/START domain